MASDGIKLQQRYAAAVERVFGAWTDPAEMKGWWGPAGFTATELTADIQPEGRWHATIVGTDGKPRGQGGTFTTVEKNRRLAFSFRWDEPDALDSHIVVDFAADGDGTVVTFTQSPFKSEDDRNGHAKGWDKCLKRSQRFIDAL